MPEKRNVLVESSRIARGKIQDLGELSADKFDAVIFPGGFGAAKNLSSFAVDGPECKVNEHVSSVVKAFHSASKPIGLCCIAPVLAARLIPGVAVTVGNDKEEDGTWPYAGTAEAIDAMGGKHHVLTDMSQTNVDTANKVVTSAAYMKEGTPHEVFQSVGAMVHGVLGLLERA